MNLRRGHKSIHDSLDLFASHPKKYLNLAPLVEKSELPVLLPCFFHYQKRTMFPYLRRCQTEKMKTLKEQFRPNGGIAWVYRLVLPAGQRGLFYIVLSLSPYLELRERFPYLTHSCKSQLNSSNSENELQTRLLSIWAHGSCQDWGRLGDHPSVQIYWPHRLLVLLQRLPCCHHTRTHT